MKSLSRVRLQATPWTAAHQAPPSMGFSRQEYWNEVPSPSPTTITVKNKYSTGRMLVKNKTAFKYVCWNLPFATNELAQLQIPWRKLPKKWFHLYLGIWNWWGCKGMFSIICKLIHPKFKTHGFKQRKTKSFWVLYSECWELYILSFEYL